MSDSTRADDKPVVPDTTDSSNQRTRWREWASAGIVGVLALVVAVLALGRDVFDFKLGATPGTSATTTLTPPPSVGTEPQKPREWESFGAGVVANGNPQNGLEIRTPEGNYDSLRGAFISDAKLCDGVATVDATLLKPSNSPDGYGFAFGVRTRLVGDVPTGWSVQMEWGGPRGAYYARAKVLPNEKTQAERRIEGFTEGRTYPLRVEVRGGMADVQIAGKSLLGGPFTIDERCGSVLFQVWGTSAIFQNLTIAP